MAAYQFNVDLRNAKKVEVEFAELFSTKYDVKEVKFNDDYKFDVEITTAKGTFKFEIKHDIMSCRTGNLALEYECRGKASGINRTEADYWIYKLADKFYLISVENLRKLVEGGHYFREVSGGDRGSNTKMYLFKLDLMKQSMKLL